MSYLEELDKDGIEYTNAQLKEMIQDLLHNKKFML